MKRNSLFPIAGTLAAFSLLGAGHVLAQNSGISNGSTPESQSNVRPIGQWNYQKLYQSGGICADRLLDIDVLNANGDEIGSVENAILNQDNRIIALIAQVGGMWDIGDTHVAIPWEEIKLTDTGVQVPIREEMIRKD